MTFIELLGVLGLILFGFLGFLVALFMGYGVVGVLVAVPVGALFGWVLGVALTGPIMRLNPQRRRPKSSEPKPD